MTQKPPEVEKEALKELGRLERSRGGAEYSPVGGLISIVVELPWNVFTEEQIDLRRAAQSLTPTINGLEKVKNGSLNFSRS